MQILDYIKIFWRRKWIIIFTTLAAALVVFIGVRKIEPAYVSFATLRIYTFTTGSPDFISHDVMYSERLMKTYATMATSFPILDPIAVELELDELPDIEVSVVSGTELLRIKVTSHEPELSALVANMVAERLIEEVNMTPDDTGEDPVEIEGLEEFQVPQLPARDPLLNQGRSYLELFGPAVASESGSGPNKMMFVAMGVIVGLVGGIGLAAVLENLDTKLYSGQKIELMTGLPVLGEIPFVRKARRAKLSLATFAYAESFRRLRTNLFATHPDALRSLLVISAEPEEGKSTVAVNLGLTVAQTGSRVILIDADLRRPALHELFDLSNEVGLSSVLVDEVALEDAVQDGRFPNVKVLTSGPPSENVAEWLGSAQMKALLDGLMDDYDLVLLDAPALLAVTDAAMLAQLVEETLLVVRFARTREPALEAVLLELAKVNVEPVGVVLNRVKLRRQYHQKYYRAGPDAARAREIVAQLPVEPGDVDPLSEIQGINLEYAEMLRAVDISTFSQLAVQDPEDLARKLGNGITREQISRERWIEQAQERTVNE